MSLFKHKARKEVNNSQCKIISAKTLYGLNFLSFGEYRTFVAEVCFRTVSSNWRDP